MRSSFRLQLVLTSVLTSTLVATLVVFMLLSWPLFDRIRSAFNPRQSFGVLTQAVPNQELSVEAIAREAGPAVVAIKVSRSVEISDDRPWWFEWFEQGETSAVSDKQEFSGGGSGFLVSSEGFIVTNRHVVDGAHQIEVALVDGSIYQGRVVFKHTALDLAVIKIPVTEASYLEFSTEPVRVGQSVVAIGNALSEFANTVSTGVVSGLERTIMASDEIGQHELLEHLIQTDAAINPGNSGGPLLDRQGKVIGVNVAIAEGYENIGFALPASLMLSPLESFVTTQ